MKRMGEEMFTYDHEIRSRHPVDADSIIADLDADPKTQKNKFTRPPDARLKSAVEDYLKLRAERDAQHSANDRT